MIIQAPELPTAGSALFGRGEGGGIPISLARADQLKLPLFGMYIGMQHNLGIGNLYQLPTPITITPRKMSGKTSQKQQEWLGQ